MTDQKETERETVETARKEQAEQIRLCTAQGLVYKAYKRPYLSGPASVLTLFASGYYGDAPWEMFFQPVPGRPGRYQLMEKVPSIVYFIVSYYAASYSTQAGLMDVGDTVVVVDAQGEHVVPVEPLS